MEGIPPEVVSYIISTRTDARTVLQWPWLMNPHCIQVKTEVEKMLLANVIYLIEWTTWVSPIVLVPKKNGKIRICVHYHQVNEATIHWTPTRKGSWERSQISIVLETNIKWCSPWNLVDLPTNKCHSASLVPWASTNGGLATFWPQIYAMTLNHILMILCLRKQRWNGISENAKHVFNMRISIPQRNGHVQVHPLRDW